MFTALIISSSVRSIIDWYFSLLRSSLLISISIFSNSSIIYSPWDSILEYIAISDDSFCVLKADASSFNSFSKVVEISSVI